MKTKLYLIPLLSILFLGSCSDKGNGNLSESDENFEKYGQVFEGKIAASYEESEEWWPKKKRPPKDAPNVIIFLLDDVGFAQVESFGGLIETPNIDALGANGLRYNNFHTTALCSPSRATLMAGRNPHKIGLGSHALTAMGDQELFNL